MLPDVYTLLPKMPLTPSGKIDRAALPAPPHSRPELRDTLVRPRNTTEAILAWIWAEVLKLDKVGIDDNFFDLGGHSLLATQLISRVNDTLGVKLPLRTLFEAPTVREMAEVITSTESYVWPSVMKMQPLGTRRPIFFVAAPNVNALGYLSLAKHLGQEQPLYGLQSQKYLKTTTDEHGRPLLEFSQAVVEELASEYVKAMREVQPHGPYMLGGMCRGAHIAFEMALQLKAEGESVSLLAILDTWVMENTYSYLFYVDYYIKRARWFLRLGAREKLHFVRSKINDSFDTVAVRLRLRAPSGAPLPPVTAIYWPDGSFVPRTYDGRITVFRVPRQEATRIRSHALGWESRATAGVDVEVVSGEHDTLLREPAVRVLASRLKEIFADTESRLSNNLPS
jgi:thioesterase domain-containing protein/acyl carrier protein